MKKTFKTFAIMMMAAIGFTACSDDDSNGNGSVKEYALEVKYNLVPNDSTVEEQLQKTIQSAMKSIGISKDVPYLYITARDSADAAPKIKEIGSKIETVLDKNASEMYGNAYIMAIEKKQLETSDSKNCKWSCWYEANYPESANGIFVNPWTKADPYYVFQLEIFNKPGFFDDGPESKKYNNGAIYQHYESTDLNGGAKGAYLYLVMTGINTLSNASYRKKLITDVVMLNTGTDSHYPEYVDIAKDGTTRRYYPVLASKEGAEGPTNHDLNCGSGYPYLWMYYTRDYRDGWVLTNRTVTIDGVYGSSLVLLQNNFREREDLYYMRAYKKNEAGEWEDYGKANMNDGVGGSNISFYMSFRRVKL